MARPVKPLPELIEDLKSSNGRVVYEAFLAIGDLGDKAEPAVPRLVQLLEDPKATFVVEDLRPRGHIMGPRATFFYAEEARRTLVAIGQVAVLYLLEALESKSASAQHEAALALGSLAKEKRAGEKLGAIRKSTSAYLKTSAYSLPVEELKIIGFTTAPEAGQELIRRLQTNTNTSTRAWAALALGELKIPEAVAVLQHSLAHDPSALVRDFSGKALGKFKQDEATCTALAERLLKDAEPEVRRACAESLEGVRYPMCLQALVKALADPWPGVRLDAAKAFWHVKYDEAIPALLKALEKETNELNHLTRDYIVLALAKQKAREALPLLEKISQNKSVMDISRDAAQYASDVITGKRTVEESYFAK